jgi:hypothetical protein
MFQRAVRGHPTEMTSSYVPEEDDQHFVGDAEDADDPSARSRDSQQPVAKGALADSAASEEAEREVEEEHLSGDTEA